LSHRLRLLPAANPTHGLAIQQSAPAHKPLPAAPAQVAEGDQLSWALCCDSGGAMMMASSDGQLLLFKADDASLRPLSRTAAGVQTMHLRAGARIVSAELLPAFVAQLLGAGGVASKTSP
jgi:DNA gyrase/topoisomerase IV subunit A